MKDRRPIEPFELFTSEFGQNYDIIQENSFKKFRNLRIYDHFLKYAAKFREIFVRLGANIDEIGNFFGNTYGSVGWPNCGEIDIMEQNGWDKNITYAYLHYTNTNTNSYENTGTTTPISDSSGTYHIYSLIWDEDTIQVLLDENVIFERVNTNNIPYDNLHYILLNIAMGGNLGGAIPSNFTQDVMEIDYVRVYEQSNLGLENAVAHQIKIYPNPASAVTHIELQKFDSIKSLSVIDITGKIVLNKTSVNDYKTQLDISALKAGLYMIRIETPTESFVKRLIVK